MRSKQKICFGQHAAGILRMDVLKDLSRKDLMKELPNGEQKLPDLEVIKDNIQAHLKLRLGQISRVLHSIC
ncbi:hypothetical protein PNQ69_20715 [Xanthomonas sp. A2111]|uniref:Uncharacterized protein n=1 Tax=Xanthomonas hawaiiensis TaxID=3003247 RepID=A0ABU2IAK7_9XANT|nr:hypothetical protein [Xanthomonas sp. A2111]MDS9995188.1 hypothetical protein [Xanthomonas sp. A2111]